MAGRGAGGALQRKGLASEVMPRHGFGSSKALAMEGASARRPCPVILRAHRIGCEGGAGRRHLVGGAVEDAPVEPDGGGAGEARQARRDRQLARRRGEGSVTEGAEGEGGGGAEERGDGVVWAPSLVQDQEGSEQKCCVGLRFGGRVDAIDEGASTCLGERLGDSHAEAVNDSNANGAEIPCERKVPLMEVRG